MGEVYEAEDVESGRRVALKVLGRGLTDENDRARFLREGRLAAAVNHPNVVYVFGTEEIDGTPVISMELASGGTLKDKVAAKGFFSPKEAVDAILQVIDGLEAAESVGVLHRDIKPSNCFVDADGTVKVGDFGLSISTLGRTTPDLTALTDLTRSGTVLGTPAFASPEQLRGDAIDVRSDIYAVCATLYSLLTGRAPFEHANFVKLVTMVAQEPPRPLGATRPDVPRGLAAAIARGLSKHPDRRFASYSALAAALAPYRSDAVGPTTLGLRVLAGAIDTFVGLQLVGTAIALIVRATTTAIGGVMGTGLSFLVMTCYFGVPEGLWGASPGKALCGLRVVDLRGQPSPWRIVVTRAAIFTTVAMTAPFFRLFFEMLAGPMPTERQALIERRGSLSMMSVLASWALMFSTARWSNGFAGLHEVFTGTRVVKKAFQQRAKNQREEPVVLAHAKANTIGPYDIVADLQHGLYSGYDPRLARPVWIRRTTPDSGVDLRRRTLSRRTRLRWLAGGFEGGSRWDAFEAPAGQPLTGLSKAQPWRLVRAWLSDLAFETACGLDDGSLPPLSGDRIWLSPSGRAWVLDFPAPGSMPPADEAPGTATDLLRAQQFILGVAEQALRGRDAASPVTGLPRRAAAALEQLRTGAIDSTDALRGIATGLVEGPASVTRERRALQFVVCGMPMLMMMAMMIRVLGRVPSGALSFLDSLRFVVRDGIVSPLIGVGLAAIVCALVLREGPLFRAFRIAIVTSNGRPAPRVRTFMRALLGWGPLVLCGVGMVNDTALLVNPGVSAFLRGPVPPVLFVLLLIVGITCSLITPQRGLQDRIARTYLVPSE